MRLRKLTLGGHTRNAFPALGRHSLDLRPGSETRLEIGAALRCAEEAPCRGAVRFLIEAESDGRRTVLFDAVHEAQWLEHRPDGKPLWGPPPGWHVLRLPLGAFAGRRLRLRFEARRLPGLRDPGIEAPLPFWTEPLVFEPRPELPNLLLISIDTLRADRLGCHGYARPTSPNIDRLAAAGVRFANATSSAPWTTPAHMSLFTGLDPSRHHLTLGSLAGRQRPLAPGIPTLAALLRRRGYHTVAVTSGGAMGAALDFDRGFDAYLDGPLKLTPAARAVARGRLAGIQPTPFFMYVHTFEVHAPYSRTSMSGDLMPPAARAEWEAYNDLEWVTRSGSRSLPLSEESGLLRHASPRVPGVTVTPPPPPPPPPPAPRPTPPAVTGESADALLRRLGLYRREVTSALYDGGIREADAFVGELLADLERLGLAQSTLVVLTSDHGEEFGDHEPHNFWNAHCMTQYDELLRVPLILRLPGVAPRVITPQVRLVDVMPTVLEWLGQAPPTGLDGRSLVPLLRGAWLPPAVSLSEAVCDGPELKALRGESYKYIAQFPQAQRDAGQPRTIEREWLYGLADDPGEKRDLAATSRQVAQDLRTQLLALLAEPGRQPPTGLDKPHDPALLERLKALGYVD